MVINYHFAGIALCIYDCLVCACNHTRSLDYDTQTIHIRLTLVKCQRVVFLAHVSNSLTVHG